MADLERVSLAIDSETLRDFDAYVDKIGANRSEVMRDLIRERLLEQQADEAVGVQGVATVTLVYDHHQRKLAEQMLDVGHEHHHEVQATLHVHLDHHHCLEVQVLRGKIKKLRAIANRLISMKGVQHGKVVVSRVEL